MIWKLFNRQASKPVTTQQTGPSGREQKPHQLPLSFLKTLIPIGDLSNDELCNATVSVQRFNPGDIIFNRGEHSDTLTYLYSGTVFMETTGGTGYIVEQNTFSACYPLAAQGEHCANAIAKSAVQIIYLPLSILRLTSSDQMEPAQILNNAKVPAEVRRCRLFLSLASEFKNGSLYVPSVPDVALRLRSSLQKDISVADAVKIINLDPAISSKLIQVANSPIYRSMNPVTNSHDAVNHLGFKTTQNLVVSISLHQLFKSRNRLLNDKVQQVWKKSIQIASLSYTLASLSRKINPDDALLAGLIHNIGALPIITLADSLNSSEYTQSELELTIEHMQSLLGGHILQKWNFPDNMVQIPTRTNNWYFDDGLPLQLHDIVLLAKFHGLLGNNGKERLPPLNTLPAFHKLDDNSLTPDLSLRVLHDAKQQIAEALTFFRT